MTTNKFGHPNPNRKYDGITVATFDVEIATNKKEVKEFFKKLNKLHNKKSLRDRQFSWYK